MCNKIYLDAPNIGETEKKYLNQAVDANYVSTIGPYVPEFEENFAEYLGIKRAVSVQNGTAALHIVLYELGIGSGDEIIVPALTFVATVNPIYYLGAKPVFVDVDIKTWNISPENIEERITEKTKAIIPVHLYGNPCNMDEIMALARKHNIFVVEDVSESLGAKYRGIHTGAIGDLGCFSFNGNKIITTGGGGMVVGRDENMLAHIKFLVNQARDESKGYYHSEIGFNYRMTNIEAALGLAQIQKLNEFLIKKREFNRIYREQLKGIKNITFQSEYNQAESNYWFTCITLEKGIKVVALQQELKKKGVPTRRIFMPVVKFPPYRRYKSAEYKNSYQIYERGLCLPSSTLNSTTDIFKVCGVLRQLIGDLAIRR